MAASLFTALAFPKVDAMEYPPLKSRTWSQKFRDAGRGLAIGIHGQSSFQVHVFCAVAVLVVAALAEVEAWQWCALLLCITVVMVSEMFNTALEAIAKAVDTQHNPLIRDALDIASGAVLLSAIGAAVVGTIVFGSIWFA